MAEDNITVSKDMLYGLVLTGLVGLLVLSVFTQGFGIGKSSAQPSASQQGDSNQPNAPTQPSGPNVAAGTGKIVELMDDDIKLGSDSAPVVMIEFSDFQCPFCRKFYTESFANLKKDYVDTGKVQLVFRDFPLSFHPSAQKAAEAAECAADQNKGWEMHDKMFEEQAKLGSGTVTFSVDDLKSWASQLGLDTAIFSTCLDSGKYSQEVQNDESAGIAAGIQGTPSFIFAKRDGSSIVPISGAQPYGTFKSTIDQLLQ